MRGFNLFAAFLGMAMIAIAVGYSIYAQQMKVQRIDALTDELARFDTAGVADSIKMDVYSTVLNNIRAHFHEFFAEAIITPPQDKWNSEDSFKKWFEEDYARSEDVTYWVASQMVDELAAYTSTQYLGDEYTITYQGDVNAVAGALKGAVSAKIRPDGTFVYIIDTTKLSPEAYTKLPKIIVQKRGSTSAITSDVILPRGKWEIPVPLRILTAYKVARATKSFMEKGKKYKYLSLALGHCHGDNLAICDAFVINGDSVTPLTRSGKFEDLFATSKDDADVHASIVSPCTYQKMNYLKIIDAMGADWDYIKPILKKILENERDTLQKLIDQTDNEDVRKLLKDRLDTVKKSLQDIDSPNAEDLLKDGPCRGDYETLGPILNLAAVKYTADAISNLSYMRDGDGTQLVQSVENFSISPDIGVYKRYETAKVLSRTAINLAEIVCNEIFGVPDLVLELMGLGGICDRVGEHTVNSPAVISYGGCSTTGSVYCVAPTKYSYIVAWSDPNEKYRVDPGFPATFKFRIVEGDVDYKKTLEMYETVTKAVKLSEEDSSTQKEREKQYSKKILAKAADILPGIMAGCLRQYTEVELKCGYIPPLSDENVQWIMTGIRGTVSTTTGSATGTGSMTEEERREKIAEESNKMMDSLKDICKRIRETDEKITESIRIPGMYNGADTTTLLTLTKTTVDLMVKIRDTINGKDSIPDDAKTAIQTAIDDINGSSLNIDDAIDRMKDVNKAIYNNLPDDDADKATLLQDCYTTIQNLSLLKTIINNYNDKTFNYCDQYIEDSGGGITGAIKNVVNKIKDKVKSALEWLEDKFEKAVSVSCVLTHGTASCKMDDIDSILRNASNPFCATHCAIEEGKTLVGAERAKKMIAEYNMLYHNYIVGEVARASSSGIGRCKKDDPKIQAFVRTFAQNPQKQDIGGVEMTMGGDCNPEHVLDRAVAIAKMRAASQRCKVSGDEKHVLQEITWLHVGSEIYSGCYKWG